MSIFDTLPEKPQFEVKSKKQPPKRSGKAIKELTIHKIDATTIYDAVCRLKEQVDQLPQINIKTELATLHKDNEVIGNALLKIISLLKKDAVSSAMMDEVLGLLKTELKK